MFNSKLRPYRRVLEKMQGKWCENRTWEAVGTKDAAALPMHTSTLNSRWVGLNAPMKSYTHDMNHIDIIINMNRLWSPWIIQSIWLNHHFKIIKIPVSPGNPLGFFQAIPCHPLPSKAGDLSCTSPRDRFGCTGCGGTSGAQVSPPGDRLVVWE